LVKVPPLRRRTMFTEWLKQIRLLHILNGN
jgi:hypothetical protein